MISDGFWVMAFGTDVGGWFLELSGSYFVGKLDSVVLDASLDVLVLRVFCKNYEIFCDLFQESGG